jgi:hypothetical protein
VQAGRQDPRGELPVPGVPVADTIALARAWLRGLPVVRRVPRVPVRRADVEVDVDMESFGEAGAYLWGALLSYPGGPRDDDVPAGYRAFATWEPLPTLDEARSFAAFWAWLSDVRAQAAATGRSFAAYCYNAHAENRWLLARRSASPGGPACRRWPEVERSSGIRRGSTSARSSTMVPLRPREGLKRLAPAAGLAGTALRRAGELHAVVPQCRRPGWRGPGHVPAWAAAGATPTTWPPPRRCEVDDVTGDRRVPLAADLCRAGAARRPGRRHDRG